MLILANPIDQAKTTFCAGPDMGLFQFTRMSFDLTGAPIAFPRMVNKNFRGLPFVTTYVDDVLMHSVTLQDHCNHLQQVFQKLQAAGLLLKGKNTR